MQPCHHTGRPPPNRAFCGAATHYTPSLPTNASVLQRASAKTRTNSNDTDHPRPATAVFRLPLPPAAYKPPPLLYSCRDLTYTDSSFIHKDGKENKQPVPTDGDNQQPDTLTAHAGAPRIGASVYIPKPDGDRHTVAILPAEEEGDGFDDTINGAELIAGHQHGMHT